MIGVFDSGYGGLSVFKEMLSQFPEYSFSYLGDNARAPYGIRSKEIITEYTREAILWLQKEGAEAIVLACNTASSEAMPTLQKEFDIPILGVITPVVESVAKAIEPLETIAVIATPSTIRSGKYREQLSERGFVSIIERATPLLVPLVETGKVSGAMAEAIVADALSPITKQGISSVILACTHYYFLKETINKLYPHLKLYDASLAFPPYFAEYLQNNPTVESKINRGETPHFYTTDSPDDFARFVEERLALTVVPQKIKLV